jgi:hypothetical protein
MWFRSLEYIALLVTISVCVCSPSSNAYAAGDADGLNHLFTDRETRTRMDAARKGDPVIEKDGKDGSAGKIRVDGVVIREHGDNVVWVNGENNRSSDRTGGMYVRSRQVDRKDYRVPVRLDDKTVRLKPGQVWNDENGKVSDDY